MQPSRSGWRYAPMSIYLKQQAEVLFPQSSHAVDLQVVRKRLNRPLTLAEKVCCPRHMRVFAPAQGVSVACQHTGKARGVPVACESLPPTCCQPFLQAAAAVCRCSLSGRCTGSLVGNCYTEAGPSGGQQLAQRTVFRGLLVVCASLLASDKQCSAAAGVATLSRPGTSRLGVQGQNRASVSGVLPRERALMCTPRLCAERVWTPG